LSSLNWADLFASYFGGETWAAPVHDQILAAYNTARCFLRVSPGLPMAGIERRHAKLRRSPGSADPIARESQKCLT
jgi:hypothetical protein